MGPVHKIIALSMALCLIHTQIAWANSEFSAVILNHMLDAVDIYATLTDHQPDLDSAQEQAHKQALLDELNAILHQESHEARLEAYLNMLDQSTAQLRDLGAHIFGQADFEATMASELSDVLAPYVDVESYPGETRAEKLQNIFADHALAALTLEKQAAEALSPDELIATVEGMKSSVKSKSITAAFILTFLWLCVAFTAVRYIIMVIQGKKRITIFP